VFERQERVAVLLLIVVAATVISAHLLLVSYGKQPFARPFANNSADGELVHIEGTIDQLALTRNGGHMTLQIQNITVFIPAQVAQDLAVQKGENISVYGVVETYQGKKEIVVSSADDVRPVK